MDMWSFILLIAWITSLLYITTKNMEGGEIMYGILKTLAKPQMSMLMIMKLYY